MGFYVKSVGFGTFFCVGDCLDGDGVVGHLLFPVGKLSV